MYSQASAATPSEAINRQRMEVHGVGTSEATAVASAIEALNTNYLLDNSDARRVPGLLSKGLTAAQVAGTFTVSVAVVEWSHPAWVWPWP
jgi:hypothetical protein